MPKKFHLKVDAYFEAEDLDDALSRLSDHFLALIPGDEEHMIEFLRDSFLNLQPDDEDA